MPGYCCLRFQQVVVSCLAGGTPLYNLVVNVIIDVLLVNMNQGELELYADIGECDNCGFLLVFVLSQQLLLLIVKAKLPSPPFSPTSTVHITSNLM